MITLEIERKFLVNNDSFKKDTETKSFIKQGYIQREGPLITKIRTEDNKGFIYIKDNINALSRNEFMVSISYDEANKLLDKIGNLIIKNRHFINYKGKLWMVDQFIKPKPFIMAEIELESVDEEFELPPWIGQEVTGEKEYYNSNI